MRLNLLTIVIVAAAAYWYIAMGSKKNPSDGMSYDRFSTANGNQSTFPGAGPGTTNS